MWRTVLHSLFRVQCDVHLKQCLFLTMRFFSRCEHMCYTVNSLLKGVHMEASVVLSNQFSAEVKKHCATLSVHWCAHLQLCSWRSNLHIVAKITWHIDILLFLSTLLPLSPHPPLPILYPFLSPHPLLPQSFFFLCPFLHSIPFETNQA